MIEKSCATCGQQLTAARLEANPNADQCVPCLVAGGDVAHVRRYDDGQAQTYYTYNPQLDFEQARFNGTIPSDQAFFVAMGDDSCLVKARTSIIGAGSLGEEIVITAEENRRESFWREAAVV